MTRDERRTLGIDREAPPPQTVGSQSDRLFRAQHRVQQHNEPDADRDDANERVVVQFDMPSVRANGRHSCRVVGNCRRPDMIGA